MPETTGTLIIADISGYTKYVAGTEHEHSQEILTELMDVLATALEARVNIDQLEGDALCCTTATTDATVLGWVEDVFTVYHRRLRDIRSVTGCPCSACSTVSELGMKFFLHRGVYSRQKVGSRVQLFGSNVNVVHRLTKNTVPLREYVLATDAATDGWGQEVRECFVAAPQKYDVGEVPAAYLDLAAVREAAFADEPTKVSAAEARDLVSVAYTAPRDLVWRLYAEIPLIQRWLAADAVEAVAGARGTQVGGGFHCHHGSETVVVRMLSLVEKEQVTITWDVPVLGAVYRTDRLRETPTGTICEIALTWKPILGKPSLAEEAEGRRLLLERVAQHATRMREIVSELIA